METIKVASLHDMLKYVGRPKYLLHGQVIQIVCSSRGFVYLNYFLVNWLAQEDIYLVS